MSCAIGIYHPEEHVKAGALWYSARAFGARLVFTLGPSLGLADVLMHPGKPMAVSASHWLSVENLLPDDYTLVAVGTRPGAESLTTFVPPASACYLLTTRGQGLPEPLLSLCTRRVQVLGIRAELEATALGSVVLYDRFLKGVL